MTEQVGEGKTILVTGGAGFVGSHAMVELINAGYSAVVVDNLVNSCMVAVDRVEEITGKTIPRYECDLTDKEGVRNIFKNHKFDGVIHFASLKAVGHSWSIPLTYYRQNIGGTVNLLEVMREYECFNLVFSSSATTYGDPHYLPFDEKHPTGGCTNPYGRTKYFIECILRDLAVSDQRWNIIILRYFNPVGAHKSGRLGEDPKGIPHNLVPYIAQTAVGRHEYVKVLGNDFDTKDGTGIRDYLHVVDLAVGHIAALNKLWKGVGCKTYNLGTGRQVSVFDMLHAFEKATGKTIPYKICPRREGDLPSMYSDPSLANKELGWKAERSLDEMCEDMWRFQEMNPNGYGHNMENGQVANGHAN